MLAIEQEMSLKHGIDNIKAKDLSPALADSMAHSHHNFFLEVWKTECLLCMPPRLLTSEFSKLSHLPDSTPGIDGHYKSFQKVLN